MNWPPRVFDPSQLGPDPPIRVRLEAPRDARLADPRSENQRLLFDAEVFVRSLVGSLLSSSNTITPSTVVGRVKIARKQ